MELRPGVARSYTMESTFAGSHMLGADGAGGQLAGEEEGGVQFSSEHFQEMGHGFVGALLELAQQDLRGGDGGAAAADR